MSDYLGHLVERSFAPEPRIRPQVASLFEQPSATAAFAPTPQTNEEAQPSPLSSDKPQTSFDRSAEVDNAELKSPQPNSRPSIEAPNTSSPDLATSYSQARPAASQSADAQAQVGLRPIGELLREATGKSSRAHPSNGAQPQSRDASSVHLEPSTERNTSANSAPTGLDALEVRPVIRPSSAPGEPLRRSAFEQGREQFRGFAPSTSSPAEPSIQVTIGRVEVRVTPPTAPTKSASRKEPALSLDAYLRRRSQGGGW